MRSKHTGKVGKMYAIRESSWTRKDELHLRELNIELFEKEVEVDWFRDNWEQTPGARLNQDSRLSKRSHMPCTIVFVGTKVETNQEFYQHSSNRYWKVRTFHVVHVENVRIVAIALCVHWISRYKLLRKSKHDQWCMRNQTSNCDRISTNKPTTNTYN